MATVTDYAMGKSPARAPIATKPAKLMDLEPSKGLATGLKRIGGRGGTTRLGIAGRRGRPIVTHRF